VGSYSIKICIWEGLDGLSGPFLFKEFGMQIPKRKQILRYSISEGLDTIIVEFIVKVLERSRPVGKSCRVVCLAKNVILKDKNTWLWHSQEPDKEFWITPRKVKAKLMDPNDLPLYLDWEHGVAFDKVLKGEL
jgi:hypothetical protein